MSDLQLFGVGELPAETVNLLAVREERIISAARRSVQEALIAGRELAEAQDDLAHAGSGTFVQWLQHLEERHSFKQRTAYHWISVYRNLGSESLQTLQRVSLTALYELAAPSTPEPVRQEVLQRVEAGESVSHKEIADLKRQAADAEAKAQAAEQQTALFQRELESTEGELTKLQRQAKEQREQLARLEADLQAAKAKPPEVVEKIPEGFKSAAEAEAAKRKAVEALDLKHRQLISQIEESERRVREYTNHAEQLEKKRQTFFMFKAAIAKALQQKPEAEILMATDAINEPIRQELMGIREILAALLGTVDKALSQRNTGALEVAVLEV